MAKLKDIAERAGGSISTVFRVLNHDGNLSVSFAKCRQIIEIAQELQYSSQFPHRCPQSPPEGFDSPDFPHYGEIDELEDPYYPAISSNSRAEAAEYFHLHSPAALHFGEHSESDSHRTDGNRGRPHGR